jgi:hypothetical protein
MKEVNQSLALDYVYHEMYHYMWTIKYELTKSAYIGTSASSSGQIVLGKYGLPKLLSSS